VSEGELCLRVLAAFGFGAAIGFERERQNKPAGLRTHIVVCLAGAMLTAAALYMADKLEVSGEFFRIPEGVITGIGFIGAGTILKTQTSVIGLTTAATVFMAAAVGVVVGFGMYWLALTGAGLTIFTTWGLQRFDPMTSDEQDIPREKIENADAD
jgi:putative Mg2+ transporter-C (MgtC) family protein